jgi:hypothetical protein
MDAWEKVQKIETWNNDYIEFICTCGERVVLTTGNGWTQCPSCIREYNQHLVFEMREVTEEENLLMSAAREIHETLDAFKVAVDNLIKAIHDTD